MGEKWEGLALVPAKDRTRPDDCFLFVGNDTYKLLASTDIAQPVSSWRVLDSGTSSAAPVTFTDAGVINLTGRFYLVVSR